MSFRNIAVFVDDPASIDSVANIAVNLAEAHDAHLSFLAPGVDRTAPGAYYAGLPAPVMNDGLERAKEASEALSTAVAQRMQAETVPWDIDNRIISVFERSLFISERVRYADLVLLGQPAGDYGVSDRTIAIEASVFAASVPVLMIPDGAKAPLPGGRVMIAWNESDQALHAARAAVPFLRGASQCQILIVDPPRHDAGRSDPGGALACYLNRHGARTEISIEAQTEPRIAEMIVRRANEWGASLIVMGAYGHTRLREAIFGGATRDVLELAKIPVLLAH